MDDDLFSFIDREFGDKAPDPPAPRDPYFLYNDAKKKYYRDILSKHDAEFNRMLAKVPDDWDEYEKASTEHPLQIRDETKLRLSDIKKARTRELQFESEYVFDIINMERLLIDCLTFRHVGDDDIREGIESVESVLEGFKSGTAEFKNLLLGLARRPVSDLYYLMGSFYRFFKKMDFAVEEHFPDICRDAVSIMQDSLRVQGILLTIREIDGMMKPFFSRSTHLTGWRLNEIDLKKFLEKNEKDPPLHHDQVKMTLLASNSLRIRIRKTHDFIAYYYSANDGKRFRYNHITGALEMKFKEGRTTVPAIAGFRDLYEKFCMVVQDFERKGIEGFGPAACPYEILLDFIFRAGKALEFMYLRALMYNELNDIRASILRPCEHELIGIREIKSKYRLQGMNPP